MMLSPWGELLNKENVLPAYPRMNLQRDNYTCLNGIWDYQITNGDMPKAAFWQRILVPFAMGSTLSMVDHVLQPGEALWYRTTFIYPVSDTDRVILHFEAVDQRCTVYMNGLEVGSHEGGYTPFSFDVTSFTKERNELMVCVHDDSNLGKYAFGKQRLDHGGMWYTPTAGIWQTVWLESLPEGAVEDLVIDADYDKQEVRFHLEGTYKQVVISIFEGKKLLHRGVTIKKEYTVPLKNFHPWSPDDPFLYDVFLETEDEVVKSYFGMRKFSKGLDENGILRFMVNGKPIFLNGLLDQGYSVDGLLTYPSEDAMVYEIRKLKSLGFNMLRKHVKQECRRWYYLCDKYGMLVMQDMPNGGWPYNYNKTAVFPTIGFRRLSDKDSVAYGRQDEEAKTIFEKELLEMIKTLKHYPSIFAWVPFNEGWGQFDTVRITNLIKETDPTRMVDSASGWHDQKCGDFDSRHCYFRSFRMPRVKDRLVLLSEFGGYSYFEQGHSLPKEEYGYKKFTDKIAWNEAVFKLYETDIIPNIPKGLCGCILTQVSDVEDETNGLFTADRKILKIDEKQLIKINERIKQSVK